MEDLSPMAWRKLVHGCDARAVRRRVLSRSLISALLMLPAVGAGSAMAQEGDAASQGNTESQDANGRLEEIVVTANQRRENLQDVPISITAITSDQLLKSNVDGTAALATAVPGLVMQLGPGGMQPHLRGVGTSAFTAGQENSIATYLDGVYMGSMAASMLRFNNIQSLEVYKGPQGTLFGRNATGGVINIRTRDPRDEFGGTASLSYGNYKTVSGNAYLTGGITDGIAADVALFFSHQGDGWGTNLFDGSETAKTKDFGARTKWLFTPGDSDRIIVALDYTRSKSSWVGAFHPYEGHPTNWGPGLPPPFGQPYLFPGRPWDIDQPFTPEVDTRQWGASLTYDHDFDFGTLTSITAYRRTKTAVQMTPEPIPTDAQFVTWRNPERQFSQELRLASAEESEVKWAVGLYYLNGKTGYDPFTISGAAATPPPLQDLTFVVDQKTESGAIFGQVTVPIPSLGNTNLTGGLRYTIENRAIVGETRINFLPPLDFLNAVVDPTDDDTTFRRLTWRLALDHRFSDEALGYISYNRGFKSGVYNTVPPGGANVVAVKPEILDAYEVGLKLDLLDRRLRFNTAAFYYDYADLQVNTFTPVATILQNGAKARIYGLDIDLVARITPDFTIRGGVVALKDKFVSYPNAQFMIPQTIAQGGGNVSASGSAAGNSLPFTSDLTFDIAADLTVPTSSGTFDFNATYAYADAWFALPDNILKSRASHIVNAQIGYTFPNERMRILLWGKNLLNRAVPMTLVAGANPGGLDAVIYAPPRTYGITLRFDFGEAQ